MSSNVGPWVVGIDNMVNSFPLQSHQPPFHPLDSLQIAYITIAQGSLGLMDTPTCRAVPTIIISTSQTVNYAEEGFSFNFKEPTLMLPSSLDKLFRGHTNKAFHFTLLHFYQLLLDITLVGTHSKCCDPISYSVAHGSFKSARGCIKEVTSTSIR